MRLLNNLFRRRSRDFGLFRRRTSYELDRKRSGIALGTLASLAMPFIIRKLMARRTQRAYGAAY
jgi:hypothetical protein